MTDLTKIPSNIRRTRRIYLAEFFADQSDVERTRREWTGEDPKVIRMISEEYEQFFGDWFLGKDLSHAVRIGFLTQQEADLILPFFHAYKKYVEVHMHSETQSVDHAEWREIAELAAEISAKLDYQLRSN